LLVFAPPELHRRIARFLQAQPMEAAPAARLNPPVQPMAAAPPAGQIATAASRRLLSLEHVGWPQFEQALGGLRQLATPHGLKRNGEVAVFRLRAADPTPAWLEVDRRTNQVSLRGSDEAVAAWSRLVAALDQPEAAGERDTRLVPLRRAEPAAVRKLLTAFQNEQTDEVQSAPEANPQPAPQNQSARPRPAPPGGKPAIADIGLMGPVQVEFLEGLGVIVIRGNTRDVNRVSEIVKQIEQLSAETRPVIEVYPLQHVDSVALLTLLAQVYEQVPSLRQTRVSLTPLGKPNAILLIGRAEGVKTMLDLIERLDQPVEPTSQFEVIYLKHSAAADAQTTLQEFFAERPGLGTRVQVTADVRTNSLLVKASPRDVAEVAALIRRIDTPTSKAMNELRVFPLQNSLATDLAPILQQAITGEAAAGPPGGGGGGAAAPAGKSTMLRLTTIDARGRRQIESGILSDVSITPDPRGNALVVSAPAASMDLIGALVRQLDQMPAAQSQIKVFTILNGDAIALMQMLQTLFGAAAAPAGPGGAPPPLMQAAEGRSLAPLRFSVDPRTNSIIAAGSVGDLNVVEAILLRLDAGDVRERESVVYRLKNAPATDVAAAINQFLASKRQVRQFVPGVVSPFEMVEREVIVVPEVVSNSLIVSATPQYFDEIRQIVEQLDARPPLVTVQVLLAQVELNNVDEFGIELGLQDSVLFDRSVLQTIAGGAPQLVPGFNFNNTGPLGSAGTPVALANSTAVGGQGLTNFGVGRSNSTLGFGGLVLSASSENVSILLRALNECRRVDVLARPQITTLDNQPAFIQVGQRVPRIASASLTQFGQINSIELINIGLILGITPRISPDGLVVMEIDAERSEISAQAGVPVSIAANGEVIRSPIFNTTTAQTTVSALSGQTIVLGGLITKNRNAVHRRVPVLSEVPVLGNLFRYDSVTQNRTELLIIMTPRVIRSEQEADIVKQVESSRMSWCLADVVKLHGPSGLRSRSDLWTDGEVPTIYPDLTPLGVPPAALQAAPPEGAIIEGELVPPGPSLPSPAPRVPGPTLPPQVPGPPPGATGVSPGPAQLPGPNGAGSGAAPALYFGQDQPATPASYAAPPRVRPVPPVQH
jgi:type II secretion system protein D